MPTPEEQRNIETINAYLYAVDAFDVAAAAPLLADDVVQTELPNAMTPAVKRRDRETILVGVREAGYFLARQRTEAGHVVASGDDVAIEALWRGELKVELGPLRPGDLLQAYFASFFTLRDGKIAAQRNYWIYELPPQQP